MDTEQRLIDEEVSPHFSGKTYNEKRDTKRLAKQCQSVFNEVKAGEWRTLKEIAEAVGAPEASVSARLRDLRKKRFGSYVIERQYVSRGLYRYRLALEEGGAKE